MLKFGADVASYVVPQQTTGRQRSGKVSQGVGVIGGARFPGSVPLYGHFPAGRVTPARGVISYPFRSGAMGNKDHDIIAISART